MGFGRNIQNHYASNKWNIIAPSSNDLNLMDYISVKSFFNECKPDIVLHCAGRVGGISANIEEPVAFLDSNIVIGRNVIMGAREAKIKKLINLASTCIYPREAQNPLKEKYILEGKLEPTNEGYALAKMEFRGRQAIFYIIIYFTRRPIVIKFINPLGFD